MEFSVTFSEQHGEERVRGISRRLKGTTVFSSLPGRSLLWFRIYPHIMNLVQTKSGNCFEGWLVPVKWPTFIYFNDVNFILTVKHPTCLSRCGESEIYERSKVKGQSRIGVTTGRLHLWNVKLKCLSRQQSDRTQCWSRQDICNCLVSLPKLVLRYVWFTCSHKILKND